MIEFIFYRITNKRTGVVIAQGVTEDRYEKKEIHGYDPDEIHEDVYAELLQFDPKKYDTDIENIAISAEELLKYKI